MARKRPHQAAACRSKEGAQSVAGSDGDDMGAKLLGELANCTVCSAEVRLANRFHMRYAGRN